MFSELLRVQDRAVWEDPEFTSSQGHNKYKLTYGIILSEKNLKTEWVSTVHWKVKG